MWEDFHFLISFSFSNIVATVVSTLSVLGLALLLIIVLLVAVVIVVTVTGKWRDKHLYNL